MRWNPSPTQIHGFTIPGAALEANLRTPNPKIFLCALHRDISLGVGYQDPHWVSPKSRLCDRFSFPLPRVRL